MPTTAWCTTSTPTDAVDALMATYSTVTQIVATLTFPIVYNPEMYLFARDVSTVISHFKVSVM